MEQKSNVQYRAEKEYKNSREKFFLLLREIISNSIHAVLIRQNKETNFIPQLDLNITFDENQCKIELRDNGEGFTEKNRLYFEELDKKNLEKEQFNFHPLGQGRLAIVYFTDSSEYETVYKDKDGTYQKRTIPYPNTSDGLFNFDEFVEEMPEIKDTYTKLTAYLNKQNTLGRAKTFFYKYPNSKAFKQWFIETFFPFIVTNEQLVVNIIFNGEDVTVKKGNIISQDIKAGTILKKGDTIRVTVSKGALVTIPDVAGKKKAKAKETITNAKLIMKVSDRKWSDKVAKGKVISQDKKAGEKIEEGNTISVVISKGVEQVKVPKVEGETLEEAQKALKKAKLKVDSSRTYSSSVEEGKIISQSIASGKTVDKNTTVKVVISLGKEPEPEPVYRPSSSSSSSGSSSSGRKSYRRSGSSSSSSRKSSGSKKKSSGGGDSINNWNLVN